MGPVGDSPRLGARSQGHGSPEDLKDEPEGDEEQCRYPGDAAERGQKEENANCACGQEQEVARQHPGYGSAGSYIGYHGGGIGGDLRH